MKQNTNINIAMLQLMTTKQLKKWYQEYQCFMDEENLPDFFVKLNDDYASSTEASIFPPINKNDSFIFKIKKSLIKIKGDNAKATAFHEFTHIFDDCMLLQECDIRTRVILTKLYSEYHAIQIQLMCACQFDKNGQHKPLSASDIVRDNIYSRPINDYLEFITADYKATIADRTKSSHIDCFDILLHTIYYMSSIEFFKNYCIFNIHSYIDENYCMELCGKELIELISQYKNTDFTLSSFEIMNELDVLIAKNINNNLS